MTPRNRYILTLEPTPAGLDAHGREPVYRLRLALKALLRWFGLRCIHVQEARDESTTPTTLD